MKLRLPKDWQALLPGYLIVVFIFLAVPTVSYASVVTTTFAHNNGQSGNMFDIDVLASRGNNLEAFDLNLDAGNWDVRIYAKSGTHVGFESTAADWTLHDSINGLASAGEGNATNWDFSDLILGSRISAFYVTVTNGTAMNYTNGSSVGALAGSDSIIRILQGTGNASLFGTQFRPRVWNGSAYYTRDSGTDVGHRPGMLVERPGVVSSKSRLVAGHERPACCFCRSKTLSF